MQVLGNVQSTAQVHPEKLTKAMMAAAESRGAQVRIGSVQGIVTDDSLAAKVTGACVTSLMRLLCCPIWHLFTFTPDCSGAIM